MGFACTRLESAVYFSISERKSIEAAFSSQQAPAADSTALLIAVLGTLGYKRREHGPGTRAFSSQPEY